MIFPVESLYELERRVYVDSWSIPYKPTEALGKCLIAATDLALEGDYFAFITTDAVPPITSFPRFIIDMS